MKNVSPDVRMLRASIPSSFPIHQKGGGVTGEIFRRRRVSFLVAMLTLAGSVWAFPQGVPVGPTPLLEENFSYLAPSYAPNSVVPSGWDSDLAGGKLAYAYHQWFKLMDSSAVSVVKLSKSFSRQTTGTVEVEFRFKLPVKTDGIAFQLWDGPVLVAGLETAGGNLCRSSAGGAVALQAYVANQEYGVKLVCDISARTATTYIDGVRVADAVPLPGTLSGLDRISIETSAQGQGDLFVGTVRITHGYLVYERFTTTRIGGVPADWTFSPGDGSGTVQRFKAATLPDTLSFRMTDTGTTATSKVSLKKSLGTQTGKLAYECKFLLPQKVDYMTWETRSGGFTVSKIRTAGGNIGYVNNFGQDVALISNYRANFWYHLKVVVDPVSRTSDIFINGKKLAEGAPNEGSFPGVNEIMLHTPAYSTGEMWLDDILVYPVAEEPADYVSAPAVSDDVSAGYEVGVQNCSLWREGTHLGWDRVNPFVERKPLLGWYDEGSPEVADWEIKWMVEHGIDYQLFCWFRPAGAEGQPIKDPYASHALHEGFFNAKYSSRMKFAVAWENNASSAASSADFRNHIIPYWIEYYFKDPRYLKIDNKPVVSIYSFKGLQRDFGSNTNIRNEMDALRQACVDAGFGGAILMTSYNGLSSGELTDRKAAGFDYIFAYNWGEGSRFSTHQKVQLAGQRDAGLIDVIPTLSMGRDDGPWGGYELGYLQPAGFRDLALWAQSTFMPSLPVGKLGRTMVMLDNWNEFGEGHFLMPSELAGFSYLEAIRTAFGGTTSSQSQVPPTAGQLGRISTMYQDNRLLERVAINLVNEPGFEGAKIKCGSWGATTALDGQPHEGAQSLKVTKQDNYGSASFPVAIRNQREYYFSAWGKLPVGATPGQKLNFGIEYYVNGLKHSEVIGVSPSLSSSEWKQVSGFWTIDETQDFTNVRAYVFTSAPAVPQAFYLDDVELSLTGNLICDDPGFEGARAGCTTWLATAVPVVDESRTGAQSLKITGTGAYGSAFWPIRAQSERTYTYSIWVKVPPGGPAGQKASIAVDFLTGTSLTRTQALVATASVNSSGWTLISGNYKISGALGDVYSVRTYVYLNNPAAAGVFFVDDIEVR